MVQLEASIQSNPRSVPALGPPEVAIVAVAIALQIFIGTGADVSWLLVVGDRILSGDKLYIDIWETNPPLSVLLYMPAVVAERLIPLSAEAIVLALVLFAAAASAAFSMRLLRAAQIETPGMGMALAVVLTILPLGAFGQREHIGFILQLPILALVAALAAGVEVGRWTRVAAGLAGGLAVAIKPHFLLPILFAYLFAAWRLRSARICAGLEVGVAALAIVSYAASVLVFFPSFVTAMLPILEETYRHARKPLTVATYQVSLLYIALLVITALRLKERRFSPFLHVLLAASLGSFAAYLEQGKGWPYHLYPAVAAAFQVLLSATLADCAEAAGRRGANLNRGTGFDLGFSVAVLTLLIGGFYAARNLAGAGVDPRQFAEIVRAIAPARPKLLTLSPDIAVGHPLTRLVDGIWVGTTSSQWLYANASDRGSRDTVSSRDALVALMRKDRNLLVADIRSGRPDVLLFDRRDMDWLRWAQADPQLSVLLQDYAPAASAAGIDIWRRVDG